MPNELYRDFIDGKADEIINSLGGTITPAPDNAELYRDFLDRKFDDVITAIGNYRTPIKSFTYTGTGTYTNHRIDIPQDCRLILYIERKAEITGAQYDRSSETLYILNSGKCEYCVELGTIDSPTIVRVPIHITFYDGYILCSSSSNQRYNLNELDVEYTVYYI